MTTGNGNNNQNTSTNSTTGCTCAVVVDDETDDGGGGISGSNGKRSLNLLDGYDDDYLGNGCTSKESNSNNTDRISLAASVQSVMNGRSHISNKNVNTNNTPLSSSHNKWQREEDQQQEQQDKEQEKEEEKKDENLQPKRRLQHRRQRPEYKREETVVECDQKPFFPTRYEYETVIVVNDSNCNYIDSIGEQQQQQLLQNQHKLLQQRRRRRRRWMKFLYVRSGRSRSNDDYDDDENDDDNDNDITTELQLHQQNQRRVLIRHTRSIRRRLFLALTEPQGSTVGSVIWIIVIMTVLLMILMLLMRSMSGFQYTPENCHFCDKVHVSNSSNNTESTSTSTSSSFCVCPPEPLEWTNHAVHYIVIVLTAEILLRVVLFVPPMKQRFVLVPNKQEHKHCYDNNQLHLQYYYYYIHQLYLYIRRPQFVIDGIAILPYWFSSQSLLPLRILQSLVSIQVLRLGRYNRVFRSFKIVVTKSFDHLKVLIVILIYGAFIFGSLIYWAELGTWQYYEPTGTYQFVRTLLYNNTITVIDISPYTSIPKSFWWFIVTATTVGYGDIVPVTPIGQLIATGAMLMGLLVIAYPVSVFSELWSVEIRKLGAVKSKITHFNNNNNDDNNNNIQSYTSNYQEGYYDHETDFIQRRKIETSDSKDFYTTCRDAKKMNKNNNNNTPSNTYRHPTSIQENRRFQIGDSSQLDDTENNDRNSSEQHHQNCFATCANRIPNRMYTTKIPKNSLLISSPDGIITVSSSEKNLCTGAKISTLNEDDEDEDGVLSVNSSLSEKNSNRQLLALQPATDDRHDHNDDNTVNVHLKVPINDDDDGNTMFTKNCYYLDKNIVQLDDDCMVMKKDDVMTLVIEMQRIQESQQLINAVMQKYKLS